MSNSTKLSPKNNSKIAIRTNRATLADLYREESDRVKTIDRHIMLIISTAISKGLPPEDAAATAFVAPHQFKQWYNAGKALMEGRQHNAIPDLLPQQPDEEYQDYTLRKQEWRKECDLLADFYLLCNQGKQALNESMMTIMTDYAKGGEIDSWRAAEKVLKMTGGYPEENKQIHEHHHSGEILHTQQQQVYTMLEGLLAIKQAANQPMIIEAEIKEDI